ncbi:MAG: alpha/beta fold hydrolase [archaeon]|nr:MULTISPECIES: alpha/beta fold hydrolase [Methanobrevibacter]MCQ2970512.1 alpha/beta fold hydrolase [archaeon]OEC99583.1 hypothetical protein A9505_03575 [Methanobrevibacter sp. A27]
MSSFEFESGRILKDVNVEYSTMGFPKYDEDGNITNAIVFCPTLKGERSVLANLHNALTMDNISNDDEFAFIRDKKYFFIRIVSLGSPESCSPSTTDLKHNFPNYTFRDCVNFKKQFLKEKFNLDSVLAIVGEGVGGCEVFTWACEYPDYMEFILSMNNLAKLSGTSYIFFKSMESVLESNDKIYSDVYDPSLSKLVVAVNKMLFLNYLSRNMLSNLSRDELDALLDNFVEDGLFRDVHDLKYLCDCLLEYDVNDKLSNIKAKTILIAIEGQFLVNVEKEVLPLENAIDDVEVMVIQLDEGEFDNGESYSSVFKIFSFLNEYGVE